jgi:glycosyltransferase involved in cell wall biosynthesis
VNVVCFGQTNWDFCWTGKQQLMSRLAARGHRVLYVDPVWSVLARRGLDALRALAPARTGVGLRALGPGLWVHTPTPSPWLPWRVARRRQGSVLRALVRRLGLREPVVVTLLPRAAEWAEEIPAAGRIHYAIDEMTAFGGLDPEDKDRVRRDELRAVQASDVVLAISPRLCRRLADVHPRTYLLPSGADVPHFREATDATRPVHASLRGVRRPRLGFMGQIDERLDQELLLHVAAARPDWQIVLAGRVKEGVDLGELLGRPNVHATGFLPYAELPDLLRGVHVALLPYRDTPLTQSCSPLKVYEYLAADRPVVSTPIEGLAACRMAVRVAETPEAFVEAVADSLARPEALRAERRAVAEASSWEHRTDELEMRLEEARRVALGLEEDDGAG